MDVFFLLHLSTILNLNNDSSMSDDLVYFKSDLYCYENITPRQDLTVAFKAVTHESPDKRQTNSNYT